MSLRTFLLGGYWPDSQADPDVISTKRGPLGVRPIIPSDMELAKSFIEGLEPMSRYYRFFQSFRSVPPSLLDRLVVIDPTESIALIAVAAVDGEPRMIGEARYSLGDENHRADIAIAVDDGWHGLGVGRGLLQRLEASARTAGIHHFNGEVMVANDKMIHFARATGFQIWPDDDDRRYLRISKTLVH